MNDDSLIGELYQKMLLIREFELSVLSLFEQGKLYGTTHAYIGQEANAVGVISNLGLNDIVVSNHRCHGHYLAKANNPYALLCEMMGKQDGLCSGRGGSQHICDEGFFSNGVLGGIVPFSAGLAFAEKFNGTENIVAVFIGDGTLGEGVLYETLNIASKWKLPLFVIVENNRYAQSTKVEDTLAGSIIGRFQAFDVASLELDTFDVLDIYKASADLANKVRLHKIPQCLILNTYRFASHSKSDDGRDKNEIEKWKKRDPILLAEKKLKKDFITLKRVEIEGEMSKNVERAINARLAE